MPQFKAFSIEHAGQRWTGTWHLEGKDLCVSSAYGSSRKPLGRAKAETMAARELKALVAGRKA